MTLILECFSYFLTSKLITFYQKFFVLNLFKKSAKCCKVATTPDSKMDRIGQVRQRRLNTDNLIFSLLITITAYEFDVEKHKIDENIISLLFLFN